MSAHLELRDLLGPYVINALGPEEKRQVEEHLGGCSSCKDEVRDLRLAHQRLTELANTEQTPPQDLKSRVLGSPPRLETRRAPLAAANLEATALAPWAGGELRVHEEDPNAQAELEVWGLPRPGPNQYYELWFGEEGGRVSAATFTADEGGQETLYMTVPEDASGYGQVGITIEEFPEEPRMSAAKPVLTREARRVLTHLGRR